MPSLAQIELWRADMATSVLELDPAGHIVHSDDPHVAEMYPAGGSLICCCAVGAWVIGLLLRDGSPGLCVSAWFDLSKHGHAQITNVRVSQQPLAL